MFRGHLFQKRVGMILINNVDAVTDAFGLSLLDGQTNMATQTFVRNQTRCKLARVQAHVDFCVPLVKEADDAHVQSVVGHGCVAVFGHD